MISIMIGGRRATLILGPGLASGCLLTARLFFAQDSAPPEPSAPPSLPEAAIAAYRASDYESSERLASQYVAGARAGGRGGMDLAEILFVLGHSRYEIQHRGQTPYPGDYRADVIAPLEESFRILQDNPDFKTMLLGNAYYDLWTGGGHRDREAEAQARWYYSKSTLIRESEINHGTPDPPARDLFARYLLFYLDRCLEMASYSVTPDLYLISVRQEAPWGFSSSYSDRFWQIYNLTYFDDGNMKAAALWQRALDALQDRALAVDDVLARFQQAVEASQKLPSKAEIYRQMADYLSILDLPERRQQAAGFVRLAFDLNPSEAEIRRQFGSALHVLSFGAYASGRFDEALRYAQEAVGFEWQGMELAHFDLSRAAAELGRGEDAIVHGEKAYRVAKGSVSGAALQPYAQNYVNILQQFGQEGLAGQVREEESSLGVH